jgi:single-strand DNA-binding protein
MAGINKVILIGNVGQNPDIKYMQNGKPVARLSVATSETWKDKETGEKKESTEWHKVVFFSPLAEVVEKYVHKGSKIFAEGKLKTNKWQHEDGTDRYSTDVICNVLQMLDEKRDGQTKPQATATQYAAAKSGSMRNDEPDDDIPF